MRKTTNGQPIIKINDHFPVRHHHPWLLHLVNTFSLNSLFVTHDRILLLFYLKPLWLILTLSQGSGTPTPTPGSALSSALPSPLFSTLSALSRPHWNESEIFVSSQDPCDSWSFPFHLLLPSQTSQASNHIHCPAKPHFPTITRNLSRLYPSFLAFTSWVSLNGKTQRSYFLSKKMNLLCSI